MDILQKLQEIVTEYRGENIELKLDTTFDDLGFDSLDKVELLLEVEKAFNFKFPNDVQISGVSELIDLIKKNI